MTDSMEDKAKKDLLLSADFLQETEDIKLERGKAGSVTITIRALSRDEALTFRKRATDDPDVDTLEYERGVIAAAVVSPKLSTRDVAAWQKSSRAGELEIVTNAIMKMSGMGGGAAKGYYKSTSGES